MAYAREAAAISPEFKVFPSTEAVLMEARARRICRLHLGDRESQRRPVRARLAHGGDAAALDAAVTIRKLFDGKAAGLRRQGAARPHPPRSGLARVKPPLAAFPAADRAAVRRLRRRAGQKRGLRPPLTSFGRALTCPAGLTISGANWRRLPPPLHLSAPRLLRTPGPQRSIRDQHGQYQFRPEGTRVIARRTEINKSRRSRLRTTVGKVEEAIASGDRDKALAALKEAEPIIMRAAQKGVVHPERSEPQGFAPDQAAGEARASDLIDAKSEKARLHDAGLFCTKMPSCHGICCATRSRRGVRR